MVCILQRRRVAVSKNRVIKALMRAGMYMYLAVPNEMITKPEFKKWIRLVERVQGGVK